MATAAALAPPAVPKHIEVCGRLIRFRFAQQLIWGAVAALAGAYIISALYYGITQVNWHLFYLKHAWDFAFAGTSWHIGHFEIMNQQLWADHYRHGLRDFYEGVLATPLTRTLLANWKKHPFQQVADWRVITVFPAIFLVALPLILIGIWLLYYHLPAQFQQQTAVLGAINWQPFLIGAVVGQAVHRFYAPVGNTIQLHFVSKAVARADLPGRTEPLWVRYPLLPPVLRERFAWLRENIGLWLTGTDGTRTEVSYSRRADFLIPAGILLAIVLAIAGAYVRLVIARGH